MKGIITLLLFVKPAVRAPMGGSAPTEAVTRHPWLGQTLAYEELAAGACAEKSIARRHGVLTRTGLNSLPDWRAWISGSRW